MSTGPTIDWNEVWRRLEEIAMAVEQEFAPEPEEERIILRRRAAELARLPGGEEGEEKMEAVEFELAGERYAFPLSQVREVRLLRDLTPVPCAPSFVLGIINVRGAIRTVIDLKTFFELPQAGLTELNKMILIEHGGVQMAILADAIRGVRQIKLNELQPPLPTLTEMRAAYLRGVTWDRLAVLDAEKIITDKRTVVDDEPSA